MLRRIGLVLGGLFLSAILANVYYVGFCFVFIFVAGIESDAFLNAGFWACFAAAVATIAYLFQKAWSPSQSSTNAAKVNDAATTQAIVPPERR